MPRIIAFWLMVTALGCGGDEASPRDTTPDTNDTADADPCRRGALECACRIDGGCDTGLICEAGLCATCPAGAEGCPCDGDLCDEGLACSAGTCAPCVAGAVGCSCAEGLCAAPALCLEARCTTVATCDALREAGLCPTERACVEIGGASRCLTTCADGFRPDGDACVPCPAGGCQVPSCSPDTPGGLAEQCAAESRECVSSPTPRCGACLEGTFEDPGTGACVAECGGRSCSPGERPVFDEDGDCACVVGTCAAGEALTPGGGCIVCRLPCVGEGLTGRPSTRTDRTGACVCETEPSFYWDPATATPSRCDADGDGFISSTAFGALTTADLAVRTEARCETNAFVVAELVNDLGQRRRVYSCGQGGLVASPDGETDPCPGDHSPVTLVESDRNDDDAELLLASQPPSLTAPPYVGPDGQGRRFLAAELNSLTKACASGFADYDGDGTPDLAQGSPDPARAVTNAERLAALATFMELTTVERLEGEPHDTLVIRERSRCVGASEAMALRYPDGAGPYWRECHRQPASGYDRARELPGGDLLAFTCDGSPPCLQPLPAGIPLGDQGACDAIVPERAAQWASAPWRGMGHATQFQCVLVATPPTGQSPESVIARAYTAAPERFADQLDFARCRLGAGGLDCAPSAPSLGEVGWALGTYAGATEPERGGCIDESAFAEALCPTPLPVPAEHYGDPADFGRLRCACEPADRRPYHRDQDGDGFGDASQVVNLCAPPDDGAYVEDATDCDDTDPEVFPTALDRPDPDRRDLDCDGEDGDEDKLVFVRFAFADLPSYGLDTNPGTRARPMATIDAAYRRAIAIGGEVAVLYDLNIVNPDFGPVAVLAGTTIELVAGVGIHGGYHIDRPRSDAVTPILLRGNGTAHVIGLRAVDLTAPTLVSQVKVTVFATEAPDDASAYGLWATRSPGLTLDAVELSAELAKDGADGARGDDGADGGDGGRGGDGVGANAGFGGEPGVNPACPAGSSGHAGGTGGLANLCPFSEAGGNGLGGDANCGGDGGEAPVCGVGEDGGPGSRCGSVVGPGAVGTKAEKGPIRGRPLGRRPRRCRRRGPRGGRWWRRRWRLGLRRG